jgi:hypothetical protein
MKLNWGHYIAIALGCFMIFILTLLFTAGDSGHAMVTEDYYEKELTFQNEIDAENRANSLIEKPELNSQANGFVLAFPEDIKDIKGEVYFMRNNDETQDIRMKLKLDGNNKMLIPSVKLVDGEYDFFLKWEKDNQEYLVKKTIQWVSQS